MLKLKVKNGIISDVLICDESGTNLPATSDNLAMFFLKNYEIKDIKIARSILQNLLGDKYVWIDEYDSEYSDICGADHDRYIPHCPATPANVQSTFDALKKLEEWFASQYEKFATLLPDGIYEANN